MKKSNCQLSWVGKCSKGFLKASFLILAILFTGILPVISQSNNNSITGKVSDAATNEDMIGVSVSIKGTTKGTITDIDGNFKIEMPEGKTSLDFSFVGYQPQSVEIGSQTTIIVKMVSESKKLDEVVVIGYGVMKKSDLTGAVTSIKTKDITAIPTSNAIQSLQGKVAGLDMMRSSGAPGADVKLLLRGTRSIKASNDPLIIVDGIPYGTSIDINPNDIASMEILKDASSTAIYGSRGANGVILITTKRGADDGSQKISVNAYYGVNQVADYPEFTLGEDYMDYRREAYRAIGAWKDTADDKNILIPYDLFKNKKFVDWRSLLFHRGHVQNYQVGITGGNKKTSFGLSTEFNQEKGIFLNEKLDRFSGRLNIDHNISDKLKVGASIALTRQNNNKRDNPLNIANKMLPIGIPFNEDGSINIYPIDQNSINPLIDEIEGNRINNEIKTRTFSSSYFQWNIFPSLTYKSTFGVDISNKRAGQWADSYTIARAGSYNEASAENTLFHRIQWENILTYNKEIGDHSFQIMGGNSTWYTVEEFFQAKGNTISGSSYQFYHLGLTNLSDRTIFSDYTKQSMLSYFGRLHYKFKNRYIVQLTTRADGASVLAEGHKWYSFPSASFAWVVKEEEFLKSIDVISNLKIRYSYGISGQSSIPPYMTQSGTGKMMYSWDDNVVTGIYSNQVPSPNLRWESTATQNIGIDLGLFKNRINLNLDMYEANTYDLLLERNLPPHTAYYYIMDNIGETQNKGLELSLNTVNVETQGGFKWTSDFTFAMNREKIVKLSDNSTRDLDDGWFVGEPVNVHYDYKKIGVWQQADSAEAASYGYKVGEIRLADLNGSNSFTPDSDKMVIGNPRPKWTGGLNNSFSYKGFEVSFFIYARVGQMIKYEGYNWSGTTPYWYTAACNAPVVNYWTPENPTNDFPRPSVSGTHKDFNSPLQLTDGSFVKLRDVTIAYNLPEKWLKTIKVANLKIYTTLTNYFVYSKVPHYDTERASLKDGSANLSSPMTKSWIVGLNLGF